jgi:hypothetical protein
MILVVLLTLSNEHIESKQMTWDGKYAMSRFPVLLHVFAPRFVNMLSNVTCCTQRRHDCFVIVNLYRYTCYYMRFVYFESSTLIMDEHILTTLKIVIIGESGVGKTRLVQVQFRFMYVCGGIGGYVWTDFWLLKHVIVMNIALFPSCL